MTTEDIKITLRLTQDYKRTRKVKDDTGCIVREFKDENGYWLIVKTDQADENILHYDSLDLTEISLKDLKDSSMPWAKYVFCYDLIDPDGYGIEDIVFITPYIYWRDEHAQYDQTIQSRFLPDDLSEAMECTYEFGGSGRLFMDAINDLINSGFFYEDQDFADYMECNHHGLTPNI